MSLRDFAKAMSLSVAAMSTYPITVTYQTPGVYDPAEGRTTTAATSTKNFKGYVQSWSRREIDLGMPQDSMKLVIIDCSFDIACAVCFEPTCGPYQGRKMTLAVGRSQGTVGGDFEALIASDQQAIRHTLAVRVSTIG